MSDLAVCVQDDDKNVSPKETIDAIYKAGFKNVFVQYYRRDNLEFDELKQIDYCRQLGLNIIFCHLGYKNINEIWIAGEKGEKVTNECIEDLELMKEKQIDMVIMHLSSHMDPPKYNEIGLERIKKIVRYAKELGIKIAFENGRRSGYLEYVLGNIKDENAGLCYDVGHCHVFFDDEFDYEFFKNRYFAIHLHDNDKTDDLHLLPLDGTIEWRKVFSKLKENNYTGPLTLELCYRYDYLKQSIEDFYKEGYRRGQKLTEIYEQC